MLDETTPMVDLWARWSRETPEAPALTVSDRTVTWAQLDVRTDQLGRAFAERGVGEGDLVSIGLPTGVEFVEAMVAAVKLGAIPQPLSWRLPVHELDKLVDLAGPALVIGYALTHRTDIESVVELPRVDGVSGAPLPRVVGPAFKAAASGGSTGLPKIILSGRGAVLATRDGEPAAGFGMAPGVTALCAGPLYHNTALSMTLLGLSAGTHIVLQATFDPEETLRLVDRHGVQVAALVPTHMQRISRLPDAVRSAYRLDSLLFVMHNAAPCPPELKRAWIEWLGAERIVENYTSTEQTAMTWCSGTEWLAHPGTVGRVVDGEMQILDDGGGVVPPGTVGEIWMRRPPGAPPNYHYVGAEATTREGGWETVGDLGWIDEDGWVFLADRRTDMIISGGANIYPAEIENELVTHPDVLDCIVVGLPDDDLGRRVHAIVHAAPGVTEADLRAHLDGRLARYKTPRTYEFVDAPLRDDAGKARRTALAADRLHDHTVPGQARG